MDQRMVLVLEWSLTIDLDIETLSKNCFKEVYFNPIRHVLLVSARIGGFLSLHKFASDFLKFKPTVARLKCDSV